MVRRTVGAAFARSGSAQPVEVELLDRLRQDAGWLPRFSLVALEATSGHLLGHVVRTRGHVAGAPVLGLGPLAVGPEHQGRGVGHALVHAVVAAADAADEGLIALLGEPRYYRRFGFVPSVRHGIAPPDPAWGDYFQVLPLTAHRDDVQGQFAYAEPFTRL